MLLVKLKFKRTIFQLVFILVCVHFLKDLTQDILKIPTILDLLGNVNEEISGFPLILQATFIGLSYASYIAEIFLIGAIPLVLRNREYAVLEKVVWITTFLLIVYFVTVISLDPRFAFMKIF